MHLGFVKRVELMLNVLTTRKTKGHKGTLGADDMSITWIVALVSQVFVGIQTHQTVKLNMCSILYISYTPKKAGF